MKYADCTIKLPNAIVSLSDCIGTIRTVLIYWNINYKDALCDNETCEVSFNACFGVLHIICWQRLAKTNWIGH